MNLPFTTADSNEGLRGSIVALCDQLKLRPSPQMALSERHSRTRLQVPFKGHRPAFVGELNDDINDPRSAQGCVRTVARVVRAQSRRKIDVSPV